MAPVPPGWRWQHADLRRVAHRLCRYASGVGELANGSGRSIAVPPFVVSTRKGTGSMRWKVKGHAGEFFREATGALRRDVWSCPHGGGPRTPRAGEPPPHPQRFLG